VLGHNAFVALGHHCCVQRLALPHYSFGKSHIDFIKLLAHLGQNFTSSHQRLPHQTTPAMIEQIKQYIPHRTPLVRLSNPPRIGQAMPPQQLPEIGPAVVVERHQLAVAAKPFDSSEYCFEIKYDGVRALAAVDEMGWRLWGRERADYTIRYPELDELRRLPAGTLVDGELVVFDDDGRPDLWQLLRRHGLTDPWWIQRSRLPRTASAGSRQTFKRRNVDSNPA
jgi:hypothetical protein